MRGDWFGCKSVAWQLWLSELPRCLIILKSEAAGWGGVEGGGAFFIPSCLNALDFNKAGQPVLPCVCVCACVLIWTAIRVLADLRSHFPRCTSSHTRALLPLPLNTQHHLLVPPQICCCVSTWCIKETEAERSKTSPAVLFCSAPLSSNANVSRAIRQQRQAGRLTVSGVTIDPLTIHICGNLLCTLCLSVALFISLLIRGRSPSSSPRPCNTLALLVFLSRGLLNERRRWRNPLKACRIDPLGFPFFFFLRERERERERERKREGERMIWHCVLWRRLPF